MAFGESYRRTLNKLGYYDYQHGFILRHLNQAHGWDSHLEKCRSFILRSLEVHNPGEVTVLGSGWLLELPLAEMLERVNKIRLVDIIHPPEVIKQVSKFHAVELVTDDISGGLIDEVRRKTSGFPLFGKTKSLGEIEIPEYIPDYDPGMVISLNILTQLETLPVKHLMKKTDASEDEFIMFRREIQNIHLDFLKRYKSVLITDVTEVFTDKSGDVSEIQSVVTNLPDGIYKEDWTWDFDMMGSDYYSKRSVLKVAAIIM